MILGSFDEIKMEYNKITKESECKSGKLTSNLTIQLSNWSQAIYLNTPTMSKLV